MLAKFGYSILAALGSETAQGAVDRITTVRMVKRQWGRLRGRYGLSKTVGGIQIFLQMQYGLEWNRDLVDDLNQPLSSELINQIFEQVAMGLLKANMVEFS